MRTKQEIENLLHDLFAKEGGDPRAIQRRPVDGGWSNALSYEVMQQDGRRTRVYRRDIDDKAYENVTAALRALLIR